MNKNNILEKHILTRCYSSEARILELLSERYSIKGDQKPSLILMPTGADDEKEKKKSLLHQKPGTEIDETTRARKAHTRKELRNYLENMMNNQKRLIKKVQAYNRRARKNPPKKPFPLDRLLHHYEIPLFEDFTALNQLWQDYMQRLLFNSQLNSLPSTITMLQKLSSADFTGCLLTVSQSRNNNLIGLRGIVVWDAQHSFILCVPRFNDSKEWNENNTTFSPSEQVGGFRMVSKKGSLFEFDIILPKNNNTVDKIHEDQEDECIGFTIVGSRFEFRSIDRSGKKFKNHNVDCII